MLRCRKVSADPLFLTFGRLGVLLAEASCPPLKNCTRSINKYLDGEYRFSEEKIDFNTKVENEFILGFRKLKGINKKDFYNKYKIDIDNLDVIKRLKLEEKLLEDKDNIFINPQYIYTSNQILVEFLGGNYEQRRSI